MVLNRHAALALVSALFCLASSIAHGQAQEQAHKLFGALPDAELFQISPDGTALASIKHQGNDNILAIYDLGDSSKNAFVKLAYGNIRNMFWASDATVIVDISATESVGAAARDKYEVFRFLTISRDGSTTGRLLSRGGFNNYTYAGRILSLLPDDPDHVLVAFLQNVYLAHLRNGSAKVFERGIQSGKKGNKMSRITTNLETDYFVVGLSGTLNIRSDYYDEGNERRFLYREDNKSKFRQFAKFDEGDGEGSALIVVGMLNGEPVVRSRSNSDEVGLSTMSLEDGSVSPLSKINGYDIEDAIIDPYKDSVIGFEYTDDLDRQAFIDNAFKGLKAQLEQVFPGENIQILSWSRDRKKFVLAVDASGTPTTYLLLNVSQGSTINLGKEYPNLSKDMLGEVKRFDNRASDGLIIPGYITYPANGQTANLPLVVMPHGGPASRDSMSFDWWAQYFASKGYAVYQPNFRGSTGYGYRHEEAGNGERGKKMQSDIHEGVRKLISDGLVDANRVCVVGASYGGYAALASVTFEPAMYQCAVSVAGIGDVGAQFAWVASRTGDRRSESIEYLQRSIGSLYSDGAFIRSISPENHADQIKAPVMLIHGRDDTVVPITQSRKMAQALKRAGKQYEFVELDGEDHWLSDMSTRTQMLEVTGRFVDSHIGQ